MLGMAVDVFSSDGTACKPGQSGELVCTQAFPCQPVGFWPLPGFGANEKGVEEAEERHRKSYFAEFEGVWCEFVYSCLYEMTPERWAGNESISRVLVISGVEPPFFLNSYPHHVCSLRT